jgi:cytochrome c oxidase subunit II
MRFLRRLSIGVFCCGVALVLAACRGVQPMLAPGGPQAHSIARLGWFILITFSIVTIVMWALIFWVAARRRGSLEEHAPYDAPSDKRWIVFGGFFVPAVILSTIFVLTLNTMKAFPMGDHEQHAGPPMITITGHQWWWEIEYHFGDSVNQHVVDANELHVPTGRPIDIRLQTRDVIHSFWVPRLHGKVDLVPGFENRIRVQVDQPGLYRGECGEYCGPQHAHMILLVDAQSPEDFDAWLATARTPAAIPRDPVAAHGQQVFMNNACVLCHSIRGTDAHGLVGPDLTHLASRKGIASNAYPNSRGYLEAWVTHAQSMKPDAQMPNVTAFTGDDLRALVTYLEGLK